MVRLRRQHFFPEELSIKPIYNWIVLCNIYQTKAMNYYDGLALSDNTELLFRKLTIKPETASRLAPKTFWQRDL